jgi:cyclophilin family peptidyl-prolyl cis-trans isomerase
MALSGPDTGGSQYFLTLTPQPHLTGHYTVFGLVTGGLAAMDSLVEGDAINSIRIRW